MDRNETRQLFALLEQFYPNKRFKNYEPMFEAWALALEPYSFDEVNRAAVSYAAQNKYFPDLSDITKDLTRKDVPVKPVRDDSALLRRLLDQQKAGKGDSSA